MASANRESLRVSYKGPGVVYVCHGLLSGGAGLRALCSMWNGPADLCKNGVISRWGDLLQISDLKVARRAVADNWQLQIQEPQSHPARDVPIGEVVNPRSSKDGPFSG